MAALLLYPVCSLTNQEIKLIMKNLLLTSAVALGLTSGLLAAPINISSTLGGAASGSIFVNFDDLALGNAAQTAGGLVDVSFTGNGKVVEGFLKNQYAPPFLSGDNGDGFGSPNQPNGPDETKYLSAGTGSVTLDFGADQKYLGLLWGSVDDFNTLSFYNDNVLVQAFTGSDVKANPNGDQLAPGTYYVTFNTTGIFVFDSVIATSTTNSFEFDNVAFDAINRDVPETASTVALLGLGLVGLAALRRKL